MKTGAISFENLLGEQLENPEFRAEWERTAVSRAVSEIVLGHRVNKGLTQTALARLAGVSQPAIARLEAGEHLPTLGTLIKIASALEIELTVVITPPTRAAAPGVERKTAEATAANGVHFLLAAS